MRAKWMWLLCIGMGMLMGCSSDRQVDYNIGGDEQGTQIESISAKTGVSQYALVSEWKENMTLSADENGVKRDLSIEAKVLLPDAKQMSVAEVKLPVFDEDYKEKIVKNVFGSEGIYDEKAKRMVEELPKYTRDKYLGNLNGISYQLKFMGRTLSEWDSEVAVSVGTREMLISLEPEKINQVCPAAYRETKGLIMQAGAQNITENSSGISVEKARERAEEFIEGLKLEYPIFACARPLLWSGEFNDDVETIQIAGNTKVVNGYVLYYDFGINGESVVCPGTQENYYNAQERYRSNWEDVHEYKDSMKSRMELFVTDDGVIQMYAYNPLELVDETVNVSMLSMDAVKECMREALINHAGELHLIYPESGSEEVLLNEMELIYFRVRSKDEWGVYSYVPTWRLCNKSRSPFDPNEPMIENPVLVNAIDGSLLNLYDET